MAGKRPPGYDYLLMDRPIVDLVGDTYTSKLSDKCEHNTGQWVVEWDERFYPFVYANNLQKDIWLGAAKSEKDKNRRMNLLRWFCHTCGTVQRP